MTRCPGCGNIPELEGVHPAHDIYIYACRPCRLGFTTEDSPSAVMALHEWFRYDRIWHIGEISGSLTLAA